MAISSLIVEVLPDALEAAQVQIGAAPGVEVQGSDPQTGRVVITLEAPSVEASHDIANSLLDIEGVWNVNLVYVSVEDELDET